MSTGRLEPWGEDLEAGDDLYVQEVSRFFLALRGAGLFLSPIDAALVMKWEEAGVPLTTVLRGMHRGAEKLQAKKQPLRNLKRLKRYVDREAKLEKGEEEASIEPEPQPVDPGPIPGYDRVKALIDEHAVALEQLREEAATVGNGELAGLCERMIEALRGLEEPARWGAGGPVPALMGLGRRFYEGLEGVLPEGERTALQREAEASLRGIGESMSGEAQAETLRELKVSFLRERFRLFEPGRLFSLWEEI